MNQFKGVDSFKAKINIEVQWITSELTIAAIERNGGMITSKYYDLSALNAMCDPMKFFKSGKTFYNKFLKSKIDSILI